MKDTRSDKSSTARIRRIKNMLLIVNVLIIFSMTAVISSLTIKKTDEALKSKVTTTVSALNTQMKMNLDSYLERMEIIGTLIFADEKVYRYSAADTSISEYDAIKTESYIQDYLYNICIMENFVDFSMVYSNGHHVGKLSNGTNKLFGDRLYEDLSAMINRPKTADGWMTGYNGDYKRIYYVKQVNSDAILVLSFYTAELDSVFKHPGGIEDISVFLMHSNDSIIYSSESNMAGKMPPYTMIDRIHRYYPSSTGMDDDYLISVDASSVNWYIVCSAPTHAILKEKNQITASVYITALIASLLAAAASIFFVSRVIKPVNKIVDSLADEASTDLLTGVLNKRTFEKKVEEALVNGDQSKRKALILLDVDNFKSVNDTLGHAYGDKVLAEIGDILKRVFQPGDLLGRLGGDEFCVYLNITDFRQDSYMTHLEEKCTELCSMFYTNYTGTDSSYKISASIGAAVFPDNGGDFQSLYHCADKALYISKNNGKDIYTIYDKAMEGAAES